MKADEGTEHSLIEPIHIYIRRLNYYTDDIMPSPAKQRIEPYWSKFVSTLLVEIIFCRIW